MSDQFIDEAGNIWRYDEQGTPVLVRQASVGPVDPTESYRVTEAENRAQASELAAAEVASRINQADTNAGANIARRDATNAAIDRDKKKFAFELAKEGYRITDDGGIAPIPDWKPRVAREKIAQYESLEKQLDRIQELYNQGPGATKGVYGLTDYLPLDANEQFDTAAAGLQEIAFAANRVSGSGPQSDADLKLQKEANQPFASDRDVVIEEKIRQVRARLDVAKEALGLSEPEDDAPEIDPNESQVPLSLGDDEPIVPPISQAPTAPPPIGGAPVGPSPNTVDVNALATTRPENKEIVGSEDGRYVTDDYRAYAATVHQLYLAGATADQLQAFAKSQGQKPIPNLEAQIKERDEGRPRGPAVLKPNAELSETQRNVTKAINNAPVTAAFNAANALFAGAPASLWGTQDQLNAMNLANPGSAFGGELIGGVAGSWGANKLLAQAATKAAPRLGAAMAANPVASNVASDAVYSGLYGYNQGYDPVLSAALGAGGSAIGGALGKGVGRVVGGATPNPDAQSLRNMDVPLTLGQTLNPEGVLAKLENRLTSVPVVGDVVNSVYKRAGEKLNQLYPQIAADRIGFKLDNKSGFDAAEALLGNSDTGNYDGAISNFYNQIGLENTFNVGADQLAAIKKLNDSIPTLNDPQYENAAQKLIDRTVNRVASQEGDIPGSEVVGALQNLNRNSGNPNKSITGSIPQAYDDIMNEAKNILITLPNTGPPNQVSEQLKRAGQAFRMAKNYGKAVDINPQPTPRQVVRQGNISRNRFGGLNPMSVLARTADKVIRPSVPNSGTVDRLLPVALGAGAIAENSVTGENNATGTAAGVLGTLALLGTPTGQKMLQRAVFDRPELARNTGALIGRNAPFWSSVGTGAVIANQ
ncbi:MAG: hypothetical protein HRU21_10625 [Pseudomonadales bacterium]|nr:hypothetical protein [Pseudomonadales bacterium]